MSVFIKIRGPTCVWTSPYFGSINPVIIKQLNELLTNSLLKLDIASYEKLNFIIAQLYRLISWIHLVYHNSTYSSATRGIGKYIARN